MASEAEREYRGLVLLIGPGFHPDTPWDGYEPPIDSICETCFNEILDAAHSEGVDLYEVGFEMCLLLMNVETP